MRKQPKKNSISPGTTPWSPTSSPHPTGQALNPSHARHSVAYSQDPRASAAQTGGRLGNASQADTRVQRPSSPSWSRERNGAGAPHPTLTRQLARAQSHTPDEATSLSDPHQAPGGGGGVSHGRAPSGVGSPAGASRTRTHAATARAFACLRAPSQVPAKRRLLPPFLEPHGNLLPLSFPHQASSSRRTPPDHPFALYVPRSLRSATAGSDSKRAASGRTTESAGCGPCQGASARAASVHAHAGHGPLARREKRPSPSAGSNSTHTHHTDGKPAAHPYQPTRTYSKGPGRPRPTTSGLPEGGARSPELLPCPAAITAGPNTFRCTLAVHPSLASAYAAAPGAVAAPPQTSAATSQPLTQLRCGRIRRGQRIVGAPRVARSAPPAASTARRAAYSIVSPTRRFEEEGTYES